MRNIIKLNEGWRFIREDVGLPGGRVYVEVLAAGQQDTVYVNGKEAAYHESGYSIFRADVTGLCAEEGEDLLMIACDDSEKAQCTLSLPTSPFMEDCIAGSVSSAHLPSTSISTITEAPA